MAGRLWTKGLGWKKVAVALCAENTHSVVNETSHISASSRETAQFSSSRRYLSNFKWKVFQGFGPDNPVSSQRPGRYFEDKLLESCLNKDLCTMQRHFSNPATTDNSTGSSKTSTNAGILSSMFKEDAKDENLKMNDVDEGQEGKKNEGEEEDEKPKENPFLRSQRYAKWMLLATFSFGTPLLIYEFGPPKKDSQGNVIPDEYSNDPAPIAYAKRTFEELTMMKKDIVEPSSPKLLPDPLEHPYFQPPYTLVIELFGVLLHPVYDQVHGWRFKKRPGIEYLLENVGPPLYEVIIFTRESGMVAYPLIDSMDPKGYIMYRLFRDAARYKSGFKMGDITKGEMPKLDPYYQKDLTYLNRDLKRVVVVDTDKRATELQPNNGISLKAWNGSIADTELFDLASFLHTLATNEVDDVRPVLEHYRKYDDPLAAYKLAQTRMQEEQQKLVKDIQENKVRSNLLGSRGSGLGVLSNFFSSRK